MTAWVLATDGYGGWTGDCGPYTGAWPPPLLTVLPPGAASLAMEFFSAPRAYDGPQSAIFADGSSPYNNYATYPTQPVGVHLLFKWFNTGYVDQPAPGVSPESLFPTPPATALSLSVQVSAPITLAADVVAGVLSADLVAAITAPGTLSVTYTTTGASLHDLDLNVALGDPVALGATYTYTVPPTPLPILVLNETIGLGLSLSGELHLEPGDDYVESVDG